MHTRFDGLQRSGIMKVDIRYNRHRYLFENFRQYGRIFRRRNRHPYQFTAALRHRLNLLYTAVNFMRKDIGHALDSDGGISPNL
ncbi:MAG: hypothetical protein BWY71_00637 [Planctomycetes bacterium ADurb.Bin412]|nr:MAG: hypothetical protein BWY71_00637 [Planctomycetes bacterium ADurb.Bin412]